MNDNNKPTIVVLDGLVANPGDLSWEPLKEIGPTTVYDRTAPKELLERAQSAQVLLTNKTPINRAAIEALPNLRYIGVLATGYNIIDTVAAREHGVVVTNVPAYSTASVAQLAIAHLLNITNGVAQYSSEVRSGAWTRCPDFSYISAPVMELAGKTMAVVGFGHIGSAVARIALALGMKVMAVTSKDAKLLPQGVEKATLEQALRECDVLSLHCPLAADTRNLINRDRLALMKPTAVLINTSRGPVVNEQDLADALNSGKLAAAGVDVLSKEPPLATNPLLTARNCHITPHIAWASNEARRRLMATVIANVKAFAEGRPQNVVS